MRPPPPPAAPCRFELARLDIEASGDAAERFKALRRVQDEWYERGRDKGLNFDLEVAITLARACLERARSADERGAAGNDLGLALWALGERESGTARLEEAVEQGLASALPTALAPLTIPAETASDNTSAAV